LGYSLQGNRKTREGTEHPDRNAQFGHIARRVRACQRGGRPAVSVDTKKKETLGKKANVGKEYRPKGVPLEVDTYDFADKELGKAIPYGVYEIKSNEAWVSVGISRDTGEFAVEEIRCWWRRMGKKRYKNPKRLLITADSGGSRRGIPLESHQVVVSLIGSTRTAEGLEVHCRVDENDYPKGRKISDAEMANIKITRNAFHGDWNYEIKPR